VRLGARRGISLPAGYPRFVQQLKDRIRAVQIGAALSVNRELIQLYWDIGKAIVERQATESWGKSVVEKLAKDLQSEFPQVFGFSERNIWRMRAFYLAWLPVSRKRRQGVGKSVSSILPQAVAELGVAKLPQAVAEIPWGHNVVLMEKLGDPAERLWYAQHAILYGWSRAILVHHIESKLSRRQGKALTNFRATLPPPQSDLARQIVKDPYNFDFLMLGRDARERELEEGLLTHIRKFLLELGSGFAFVGQQVHLEVDGEDFYIDLLFYHLGLRCYIVIDLKMDGFKPEFAGKMNFYLSAVDDLLRHTEDKPSLGLILCKTRSKMIVEYALRDVAKPVGVARYVTKLVQSLPPALKGSLPSVGTLERQFGRQLIESRTRKRMKNS
jgi:predicted nuclease of restriction endonuclease-like (RecB) superfamily